MRGTLNENVYIKKLNSFLTALTDVELPASGSYIDVSPYSHFAFVVFYGTITSDVVFQVQAATSASGTAASVTGALHTTANATDDNDWFIIEVETSQLTSILGATYRYVTLDVSATGGSDDYACVVFMGWNAREVPVTQPDECVETVEIVG